MRAATSVATGRGPSYSGKENRHRFPTDGTDMTLTANPRSLVFWMAYPGPGTLDGASRSLIDGHYLLSSLDAVLADPAFAIVELTSLKSKKLQQQVARKIKDSGKRVAFHCQPVQWV